jgi:hypothetical protein
MGQLRPGVLMMSRHRTYDPTNPLHRLADDGNRMAAGSYPAHLKDLTGIADDIEATLTVAYDLVEALTLALPYVETAEGDEAYKPGAVAKVSAAMRDAITKAVGV